ncbi:DUF6233 domain-containing protein [Streptomyces sp. NBC_00211]|uniref:DUF6233 domain-containing protein n=1 Tax=Streptomyces sp. NBC_00211 TaxID=2975683 RepID=UPI00386A30CE
MYRIGVPLWQTAAGGGVEPAEYSTWVTAEQLRPLSGVDLGGIPAHPRTRTLAPARWAWLLDGRARERPATVHAEGCSGATDHAHPLTTMQARDALARPGATACACATRPRRCCRWPHPGHPRQPASEHHRHRHHPPPLNHRPARPAPGIRSIEGPQPVLRLPRFVRHRSCV